MHPEAALVVPVMVRLWRKLHLVKPCAREHESSLCVHVEREFDAVAFARVPHEDQSVFLMHKPVRRALVIESDPESHLEHFVVTVLDQHRGVALACHASNCITRDPCEDTPVSETRDYFDHFSKRTADTATGEIMERLPGGTYLYRDIASGAVRYATPNRGDEFAIGSRVRIDRPSASRAVVGSQDVISSRAPREQRGLSGTTPAITRVGTDRVSIVAMDPDPLELVAGGDGGVQAFSGQGFLEAVTYVDADGNEIALVEDDAPVVTDTEIVMSVSAAIDTPRGWFDAVTTGARSRRALRVRGPEIIPSLFAWTFQVAPNLLRIDPTTLALLDTYGADGMEFGASITQREATISAYAQTALPAHWLFGVNLVTNVAIIPAVEFTSVEWGLGAPMAIGSDLWFPFVDYSIPAAGVLGFLIVGATTSDNLVETDYNFPPACATDGLAIWGGATGYVAPIEEDSQPAGMIRYVIATDTVTRADTIPSGITIGAAWGCALTPTGIWFASAESNAVKFSRSTLGVLANVNIGVANDAAGIAWTGSVLFAFIVIAGNTQVFVLDDDTGSAALAATIVTFEASAMVAGEECVLLVSEDSETVYRVDAAAPYVVTSAIPYVGALGFSGAPFVSRRIPR